MDLEKSSRNLKLAEDDLDSIIELLKKDGQPDHYYSLEEVTSKQRFPKKLLASWIFQIIAKKSNMMKWLAESDDLLTESKRLKTENSKLQDQCDKLSKMEDQLKEKETGKNSTQYTLKPF